MRPKATAYLLQRKAMLAGGGFVVIQLDIAERHPAGYEANNSTTVLLVKTPSCAIRKSCRWSSELHRLAAKEASMRLALLFPDLPREIT